MTASAAKRNDRATEPEWWRAEYGTRHWICLDEISAKALAEGIVLERVMEQARCVTQTFAATEPKP